MKLRDAVDIIHGNYTERFRVSFEHKDGCCYTGDCFPDRSEPPLSTEEEAWTLARQFAARTVGRCVNIYVVRDSDFSPVDGYSGKKLNRSVFGA
jgi:hypothetical protein